MTVDQIQKALSNNDYVLFHHIQYGYYGVNCKWFLKKKSRVNQRGANFYIGFRPCNVSEYITHKAKLK